MIETVVVALFAWRAAWRHLAGVELVDLMRRSLLSEFHDCYLLSRNFCLSISCPKTVPLFGIMLSDRNENVFAADDVVNFFSAAAGRQHSPS